MPVQRSKGRKRSEKSHVAILRASLKLLNTEGFKNVTIEKIAKESRTGKQTIYRYWTSKAEIILEAFSELASTSIAVPDKGTFAADLGCFLSQTFRNLRTKCGHLIRALMGEAIFDPGFGVKLRDTFIASRRQALLSLIARGIERGEIDTAIDRELIVDMIFGPMWYRLLNGHAKLDDAFAEQITRFVMTSSGARDESHLMAAIKGRRSVRSFTRRQIGDDAVKKILEAACLAPSAHNGQPWFFCAIQNKSIIDRLSVAAKESAKNAENKAIRTMANDAAFHVFYNAPTVVLVCGKESDPVHEIACAAATQNMLLAAHSLHVGTCWIGLVSFLFRDTNTHDMEMFKKQLGIPEGYTPCHAVAVGYSGHGTMKAPKRKKNAYKIVA